MLQPLFVIIQLWATRVGDFLHFLALSLEGPGMLLVAIADSSFLSIPEGNDALIVVLSTGKTWDRMAYFVAMTTVGSVIGCMLLYSVGKKGGNLLLRRRFSNENIQRAEKLFERYGMLTVALPSILPPPCPFKIFVLAAGAFRLKLSAFIAAVIIGRTVRYSIWGVLAVVYGNSVKVYMQDNLPKVGIALSILFALASVTIALLYAYHRKGAARL